MNSRRVTRRDGPPPTVARDKATQERSGRRREVEGRTARNAALDVSERDPQRESYSAERRLREPDRHREHHDPTTRSYRPRRPEGR